MKKVDKRTKEQRMKDLDRMKDSEIDYSDISELDENFWKKAKLIKPQKKKTVSIRLDADVIDFFKKNGKGYQTKINTVLKSYMKHNCG